MGQGGIPERESRSTSPTGQSQVNRRWTRWQSKVKRDSEILWEENRILPGNVLAVRLQTKSEMSGRVAVLLRRINGTSLRWLAMVI